MSEEYIFRVNYNRNTDNHVIHIFRCINNELPPKPECNDSNLDLVGCYQLNEEDLQNEESFLLSLIVKKCLEKLESIDPHCELLIGKSSYTKDDRGELILTLEALRIFTAYFENRHGDKKFKVKKQSGGEFSFSFCENCIRTLYAT